MCCATATCSPFCTGEPAKRAVRALIAVLLKHLGLVDNALFLAYEGTPQSRGLKPEASAAINAQLLPVWQKAQMFHQWIVSSFQSHVQAHYAKIEELKCVSTFLCAQWLTSWIRESKSDMPADELKQAEAKLSYEGFCAPLLEKVCAPLVHMLGS